MDALQQRASVRDAIRRADLTDAEYSALWWRLTGRNMAELARQTRRPSSTVRDALARAVRKLRAELPDFQLDN